MIELFEKYVDWKILAFFLKYPTTSFYVKELGRKLDVSPGSVSKAVRSFESSGLLRMEEKGLAHLYRLNDELPIATHLKIAYELIRIHAHKLVERFLSLDENVISIALYGSYATGEYDEKSDMDLLIITPTDRDTYPSLVSELEEELGVKLSPQIVSLSGWQKLKREDRVFHASVLESHILLHGAGLI
ncbi:MAG: nucleotidyltransferase domain-containing protein [Thermoplasmata archaeon]